MQPRPDAFLSRFISRRRVQRARDAFDPGSGQVFSETHCSMTSMVPSWVTATTGSIVDLIEFRNVESVGVTSLEDIALRSVLLQLDNLDHETLSCVPWPIGKKIWACVREFRLDSLRTWRLFVKAYPEERAAFQGIRKVCLWNPNVHIKLDEIIKQIAAPRFEWITHLILQDPGLSKSDWGKLAKIPNLGALDILGPHEASMDDRVVRGWSEAAKDGCAFSKLRVIFLICEPWITERSLHYLGTLPALVLCNMTGCDIDLLQLENSGWNKCLEDELSHQLNAEWTFSSNPHDALRAYYRRAASSVLFPYQKAGLDEEPVLSLYKRTTEIPLLPTRMALWFHRRNPVAQKDLENSEAQATTEPPLKRRKLRATKEKSLGDVMGGFGL